MNSKLLEWSLRIGIAGEFAGHGMLAIEGKKDWISWFAKFGVNDPVMAKNLLFYLGLMDLVVAVLVLTGLSKRLRFVLLWAAVWGFWTALLRPIVGVGWLDFVERAANWGAPLALLAYYGWPNGLKGWFTKQN